MADAYAVHIVRAGGLDRSHIVLSYQDPVFKTDRYAALLYLIRRCRIEQVLANDRSGIFITCGSTGRVDPVLYLRNTIVYEGIVVVVGTETRCADRRTAREDAEQRGRR